MHPRVGPRTPDERLRVHTVYLPFIVSYINRFARVYRGLETFDWIVYGAGNYYTARAYSQLRLQIL